jgi:hypothetical protein
MFPTLKKVIDGSNVVAHYLSTLYNLAFVIHHHLSHATAMPLM